MSFITKDRIEVNEGISPIGSVELSGLKDLLEVGKNYELILKNERGIPFDCLTLPSDKIPGVALRKLQEYQVGNVVVAPVGVYEILEKEWGAQQRRER